MMRRLSISAIFASLLLLSGCHSAQSTFNAHGPAAHSIGNLSMFMTVLFIAISVIMWLLIGYAAVRRRGSLEEHAPIDVNGGEGWIAIGGILIPLIILTLIFVLGLGLLRDFPIHGMHGADHQPEMSQNMKPDIRIIGHQWWWEIQYLNDNPSKEFTTANELHLPVGRPVNIEVETADVMHSFWVPALHGKVDLIPGRANYIRLVASEPGQYAGQCGEYCGAEHSRMRILAITQDPGDYEAWLEAQRKPAAPPTDAMAIAGEQVFLSGPCSMCHTVRGTLAGGRVAPDLTHVGSREMIAANTYMNNDAYLEAWVTHAQSLKPGAQMPNMTSFSGEQLHELVAYLRQLQ